MVRGIMFFFFQENKEVCATKLVDNKCENSKKLTNFYNSNLFMHLKFILLTRVHSRFILKQSRIPLCASLEIPYTFNYSTQTRFPTPMHIINWKIVSRNDTSSVHSIYLYSMHTSWENFFYTQRRGVGNFFTKRGNFFPPRARALVDFRIREDSAAWKTATRAAP